MPKPKLHIRRRAIKKPKEAVKAKKTKKGREIERRFLLRAMPKGLRSDSPIHITQYYVDRGGSRIRIRESHQTKLFESRGNTSIQDISKYDVTKKVRLRDGVYDESITWITKATYDKLVPKAHKAISKCRFEIPCVMNGVKLKWEIDFFKLPLRLIIAEIEIPKEGFKIKMPKFIKDVLIMEVTSIKEMSNYALAEKL